LAPLQAVVVDVGARSGCMRVRSKAEPNAPACAANTDPASTVSVVAETVIARLAAWPSPPIQPPPTGSAEAGTVSTDAAIANFVIADEAVTESWGSRDP
jgi:hypothetical protein